MFGAMIAVLVSIMVAGVAPVYAQTQTPSVEDQIFEWGVNVAIENGTKTIDVLSPCVYLGRVLPVVVKSEGEGYQETYRYIEREITLSQGAPGCLATVVLKKI